MPDYIECKKEKTSLCEAVGLNLGAMAFILVGFCMFVLGLFSRLWSFAGTVAGIALFFVSPPGHPHIWAVLLVTGIASAFLFSFFEKMAESDWFGNMCDWADKKFGERINIDLNG